MQAQSREELSEAEEGWEGADRGHRGTLSKGRLEFRMSFGRVQAVSSPAIATSAPVRHLGSQGREGGKGVDRPAHETYYPRHKLKRKNVSLRFVCVCVCVLKTETVCPTEHAGRAYFDILDILRTLMS